MGMSHYLCSDSISLWDSFIRSWRLVGAGKERNCWIQVLTHFSISRWNFSSFGHARENAPYHNCVLVFRGRHTLMLLLNFFPSFLVIWGRTETKCKQSAGVERQVDRAVGGEPRHSWGPQMETDVDRNRYVLLLMRTPRTEAPSFFYLILIFIREHLPTASLIWPFPSLVLHI